MTLNSALVSASRVFACATALTLGACAVVEPMVGPTLKYKDQYTVADLNTAMGHADALDVKLAGKLNDLENFDLGTGAGTLAAGVTGLAFGIFGGGRTELLATALAGGSLIGARSFVSGDDRRKIYDSGRKAVACAVQHAVHGAPAPAPSPPPAAVPVPGGPIAPAPLAGPRAAPVSLSRLSQSAQILDQIGRKPTLGAPPAPAPGGPRAVPAPAAPAATPPAAVIASQEIMKRSSTKAAAAVHSFESEISTQDVEKARRLMAYLKLIEVTVDSHITARTFDGASALTVVREKVTAELSALKASAAEVKKELAEAVGTASAASATGAATPNTAASAVSDAAAVRAAADEAEAAIDQILRTLTLPKECLGNLANAN